MAKTYDLVIIGSGTAAQVASARVRAAGWEIAVVDHRPFGGTCALRGCDPKKMLISGAEAIDAASRKRAAGRVPDLDALDLAAGDVAVEKGRLKLNDFLQSVSNPKIYGAGDAARRGPPLTPVSSS